MLFGLLLHYFFDKQENIKTIYPISIRGKNNHKLTICKVQYLSQMKMRDCGGVRGLRLLEYVFSMFIELKFVTEESKQFRH